MSEIVRVAGYAVYAGTCGCCVAGCMPFVGQICENRPHLVEVELGFITSRAVRDSVAGDFSNFEIAVELITDRHCSRGFWAIGDREAFVRKLENVLKEAIMIYERIHAKYIATKRGLEKMRERIDCGFYGVCPRYKCNNHHLIPMGPSFQHNKGKIEFYCSLCKDDYCNMKYLKQFKDVDGACFGPAFPVKYLQEYPESDNDELEYVKPTVYGFRLFMKDKEYFIH